MPALKMPRAGQAALHEHPYCQVISWLLLGKLAGSGFCGSHQGKQQPTGEEADVLTYSGLRIISLPTPDCQVVRCLGEHFYSEERNYCLV